MNTFENFSPTTFRITRHSDAFWRVTFDNGPLNLIDGVMTLELHRLVDRIEAEPKLAVVLFDSANPDYFLAHYHVVADMSPSRPSHRRPPTRCCTGRACSSG